MSDELKRFTLNRLMKQRIDELVAENDALRRERGALKEQYETQLEEARQEFRELLDETIAGAVEIREGVERERDALKKQVEVVRRAGFAMNALRLKAERERDALQEQMGRMRVDHGNTLSTLQRVAKEADSVGRQRDALLRVVEAVRQHARDYWIGMKRQGDGPLVDFDDTPEPIRKALNAYYAEYGGQDE